MSERLIPSDAAAITATIIIDVRASASDDAPHRQTRQHAQDAQQIQQLGLYLRDCHGVTYPLRRHETGDRLRLEDCDCPAPAERTNRFGGRVAPGWYILCAEGITAPLAFPPRALDVNGASSWSFELCQDPRPYFRFGHSLVHYLPEQANLAAVLLEGDVDGDATQRVVRTLAQCGYERVLDLSRAEKLAASPAEGDALVMEFAPVSPDAIAVGRLVRSTAHIADRAGVAPCMLRLGRLVPSHHGRVVLDNELVLGFAQRVGHDEAAGQLGRVGGRLLQDLSDPSGSGLIYVVRFEENDPEAALGLAENWLVEGLLHWVEPHLVEH